MSEPPVFTQTQQAIIDVLSDGMPHHVSHLMQCLPDELASRDALTVHIVRIRKVLRPRGQDIVCELANRRIFYRHVQLLSHPAE